MNFIKKHLTIILICASSSSTFPAGDESSHAMLKRPLSRGGSSSSGYETDSEMRSDSEGNFLTEEGVAAAAPLIRPLLSPAAEEDALINQANNLLTTGLPHLSSPEKKFTRSILDLSRNKRALGNLLRAWGRKYPLATPHFEELISLVLYNEDSYLYHRDRLLKTLKDYIPAPSLHKIRTAMREWEKRCKENVRSMAQHASTDELKSRRKLVSTDKVSRALEELGQRLTP
jgi:hypothetical protein